MMRPSTWPLLVCACAALVGCGGGEDEVAAERLDPEAAARAFFEQHVFADPAAAAPHFVREADPAAFALRHMVVDPSHFRFVDFWRVRTVDNRLVVEPLFELKGRPHVTTVWFELQDEAWKVAGWTPGALPVDPAEPAPSAGARVPIPFAPAAFRGAPPATEVQVEPPWNDIRILDREVPMEALPRVMQTADDCSRATRRALDKGLAALAKPFVDCYGVSFEEGPYRRGRMTFDIDVGGGGVTAELAETTLIHPTLGGCVANVLRFADVPPPPGGARCAAKVSVTFSPVDPEDAKKKKKTRR